MTAEDLQAWIDSEIARLDAIMGEQLAALEAAATDDIDREVIGMFRQKMMEVRAQYSDRVRVELTKAAGRMN